MDWGAPLAENFNSTIESAEEWFGKKSPEFDFLNRMDVWDADFKKEVGFYPPFSRLARTEDVVASLPEGTVYYTLDSFMPHVKGRKFGY